MMTRPAILVIRLGALGDLIQSLDSFHDIRAHHPTAHITLLTTPPFAGLAARMPWWDRVWADGRPSRSDWSGFLRLIRRLRRARFDRVYDLQNNDRTALYCRLLAGPHRPEWVGAAPGASIKRPSREGDRRHIVDLLRAELDAAGVAAARPTDLAWLTADISRFDLPARFVLMVPGCSPDHAYKRWPPDRYAELGRRLSGRGLATVLVGTSADGDAVARIRAALPTAIDLSGRTDLLELAGIARRATALVGNDTGPVFIGAVLGTPTLMLMSGRSHPELWAPRGPRAQWLQVPDLANLRVDDVEAALTLE
jgi:ADP-heptose:LPS heptosyltransferase